MSKVKIQGHASGTGVLTVTAPNTSTDRTITLPDGTGTLLTTDGDGSSLTGTADATKLPLAGGTLTGDLLVTSTQPNIRLTDSDSGGYYSTVSQVGSSMKLLADVGEVGSGRLRFYNGSGDHKLEITSDGRGLSQFTAKAWINWKGSGVTAITDSHNISSVTDSGSGKFVVYFDTAMSNSNYSAVASCGGHQTEAGDVSKGTICCPKESSSIYSTAGFTCQTSVNFAHLDVGTCNVVIFGD